MFKVFMESFVILKFFSMRFTLKKGHAKTRRPCSMVLLIAFRLVMTKCPNGIPGKACFKLFITKLRLPPRNTKTTRLVVQQPVIKSGFGIKCSKMPTEFTSGFSKSNTITLFFMIKRKAFVSRALKANQRHFLMKQYRESASFRMQGPPGSCNYYISKCLDFARTLPEMSFSQFNGLLARTE